MSDKQKRLNMQTVQGKLCAELYEKHGEQVLETMSKIYGEYGEQLGHGLQKKSGSEGLEKAAAALQMMFDGAKLPAKAEFDGERIHWQGTLCPFGIENTKMEVCEAIMAMDLELTRKLVGDKEGTQLCMEIEKSMARGEEMCKGTYYLK